MYLKPRETTAKEIKSILGDIGHETFSVTKKKRMVGGHKYVFRSGIRAMKPRVGDPRYYYEVFLMDSMKDDPAVSVYALREAGLVVKDWSRGAIEVTLPSDHTTKKRSK